MESEALTRDALVTSLLYKKTTKTAGSLDTVDLNLQVSHHRLREEKNNFITTSLQYMSG